MHNSVVQAFLLIIYRQILIIFQLKLDDNIKTYERFVSGTVFASRSFSTRFHIVINHTDMAV